MEGIEVMTIEKFAMISQVIGYLFVIGGILAYLGLKIFGGDAESLITAVFVMTCGAAIINAWKNVQEN